MRDPSPTAPFRPCGPPSPGMPPAFRASRPCAGCDACKNLQLSFVLARPSMDLFHRFAVPLPRARGYDAGKDLQSSIVLARQLKDLSRPYGALSPCAGLRRLQGLTGKYCSCPSVHGPLPPLRGPPSPCAGLRRLQGLTVKYCPCPSAQGPLPPLRGTFPVRGEGCASMHSLWNTERRDVFRLEARSDCPR